MDDDTGRVDDRGQPCGPGALRRIEPADHLLRQRRDVARRGLPITQPGPFLGDDRARSSGKGGVLAGRLEGGPNGDEDRLDGGRSDRTRDGHR